MIHMYLGETAALSNVRSSGVSALSMALDLSTRHPMRLGVEWVLLTCMLELFMSIC